MTDSSQPLNLRARATRWFMTMGLKRAVPLIGLSLLALLKYVYLPMAASGAVATIAEGYGVDIEIEDWKADLFNLRAIAREVEVHARGPFARDELLSADKVIFDLSLWRRLQGESWLNRIEFEEPKVYLERSLAGRWNWEDVISPDVLRVPLEPSPGGSDDRAVLASQANLVLPEIAASSLEFQEVLLKGLRIEWVENRPGKSGGGLIHNETATLFIDDMDFRVRELRLPFDDRTEATRFTFEGRLADGKLSMSGNGNLGRWVRPVSVMPAADRVVAEWSPTFTATLYLENVGAGAFARLMPESTVVPLGGSMTGSVELAIRDGVFRSRADLALTDVTYAVNDNATPAARARIGDSLGAFSASGRIVADCEGRLDNEQFRPLQALQATVTHQAVADAPESVQVAAATDQVRLGDAVIDAGVRALQGELAERLGDDAAGILASTVRDKLKRGDTAEKGTEGAKKPGLMGRVKRVFQRKKKGS